MRILFWLIALPVIAVAMAFAVSNSESATIGLWPLDDKLVLPLYAIVTGALFLGLVVGLVYGWAGNLRVRQRARNETRRANKLEAEAAELRRKLTEAESVARALPPPLPPSGSPESTLRIGSGAPE